MQYGIPITSKPQPVNAMFGSLAWAFTDDEISGFLKGGLSYISGGNASPRPVHAANVARLL